MRTQAAVDYINWLLANHSVTHDALCRGGKYHRRAQKQDTHLEGCTCDTGRAWRLIVRKLKLSPRKTHD